MELLEIFTITQAAELKRPGAEFTYPAEMTRTATRSLDNACISEQTPRCAE